MNFIPAILDIYKGSKFFNPDKNIVRLEATFDSNDFEKLVYEAPLVKTSIFQNPIPGQNKVIALLPEGLEKRIAISNPEDKEVGEENPKIPLAFLIDNHQYKKIAGGIGNSSFNVGSDSGSQEIEDLDFFIPAGFTRNGIMDANPEYDEDEDIKITGIAGAKDGSILLRGPGAEISIGPEGIRMTGPIQYSEASLEKTGIMKENITILEGLPKTIMTPFPNRLPNITKAASIAGIFSSSASLIKAVT